MTSIVNEYATYEPTWNTSEGKSLITSLTKYGVDKSTGTQNMSNSTDTQTVLFNAQFDYNRSFGQHNVDATILGNGYQRTISGTYHRTSNVNLGLLAGYNYAHRYYAELSMAAVHSAKLVSGHRNAVSPVGTIAWQMKGEPWLKDVAWLDNLRLEVSGGVINEDLDLSDYYMYDNVFTASGQWWGWSETAQSMQTSLSTRGANKDLDFVKRKEWRVGLRASFLDELISVDANYFRVKTDGHVVIPSTVYPSFFQAWNTSFLPYTNYNNQTRNGVDFTVRAHKKFGEWDITLGTAGMYYWSKNDRISENNEYSWLNATGTAIETIRGYHCLGYFQSEEEIKNSPVINSNTKPGDLKYEDLNGDGIIDGKDMRVIGKWQAPFCYGLNATVKYKGFTLFLAGTGSAGGKGLKNNQLYWVYGDGKYSDVQLGRWTKDTAATATFPRLTTQNGDLDFVASDYWLYSTTAFYLSRAQLTYDFPEHMFQGSFVKGLSVYAYGTDLLTIANERKYLETNVGAAPQCRSYNLGVKVNF